MPDSTGHAIPSSGICLVARSDADDLTAYWDFRGLDGQDIHFVATTEAIYIGHRDGLERYGYSHAEGTPATDETEDSGGGSFSCQFELYPGYVCLLAAESGDVRQVRLEINGQLFDLQHIDAADVVVVRVKQTLRLRYALVDTPEWLVERFLDLAVAYDKAVADVAADDGSAATAVREPGCRRRNLWNQAHGVYVGMVILLDRSAYAAYRWALLPGQVVFRLPRALLSHYRRLYLVSDERYIPGDNQAGLDQAVHELAPLVTVLRRLLSEARTSKYVVGA